MFMKCIVLNLANIYDLKYSLKMFSIKSFKIEIAKFKALVVTFYEDVKKK